MAHKFTCTPAAKTALKPDYAGLLVSQTGLVEGNLDTFQLPTDFGDLARLRDQLDQLRPDLVLFGMLFFFISIVFLICSIRFALSSCSISLLYCTLLASKAYLLTFCTFVHVHTVSFVWKIQHYDFIFTVFNTHFNGHAMYHFSFKNKKHSN